MELLTFCFRSDSSGLVTILILFGIGSGIYAMYDKYCEHRLEQINLQIELEKTKNKNKNKVG